MGEQITARQKYRSQLDEAINELNASYVTFDNIEFLINVKKMNDDEKKFLKETINKIRIYESHAYIRLKTIEKDFDKKYAYLEEARKKIRIPIPDSKDVETLVLEYNKIQAQELEGEKFFKNI